jgi:hypothetical protein
MKAIPTTISTILAFSAFAAATQAFSPPGGPERQSTSLSMSNNNNNNNNNNNSEGGEKEQKGVLEGLKGIFSNFDNVVDDFVYKRMGAGEQWYGKRKSNPSGNFDGDYNGMGQSDHFRIELARVQKEEMEKRRQRRLAEEEEARKNKK